MDANKAMWLNNWLDMVLVRPLLLVSVMHFATLATLVKKTDSYINKFFGISYNFNVIECITTQTALKHNKN